MLTNPRGPPVCLSGLALRQDEIQGNMESLTGQSSGPPPPPGEQVPLGSGDPATVTAGRGGLDQGCWDVQLLMLGSDAPKYDSPWLFGSLWNMELVDVIVECYAIVKVCRVQV